MTQSLKCLPCKQEDLNLKPRTHMNVLNVVACVITVILAGHGLIPGVHCPQPNLIKEVQASKRPLKVGDGLSENDI